MYKCNAPLSHGLCDTYNLYSLRVVCGIDNAAIQVIANDDYQVFLSASMIHRGQHCPTLGLSYAIQHVIYYLDTIPIC